MSINLKTFYYDSPPRLLSQTVESLCMQEATDHDSNMELIRTSLKMFNNNRDKTDASQSRSVDSHFNSNDSCTFPSLHDMPKCSTVRPLLRSHFDDLCRIYPCHEPSGRDHLPQKGDEEQSHIDLAAKIDRLCTADIVKILLQPAVLDTVVTELEKNFLSE